MTYAFVVEGRPATWQRTVHANGRTLTPKRSREARKAMAWAARAARPRGWTLDGEYRVEVTGYWPDRRAGDVDRLVSLALDALEGVAYGTDRQVVQIEGRRALDRDRPRVEVVVRRVESNEPRGVGAPGAMTDPDEVDR